MFSSDVGLRVIMNQISGLANSVINGDKQPETGCDVKPVWSVDEWLMWPYDVFGLTSLILKKTGAYRYSVIPPFCSRWDKLLTIKPEEIMNEAVEWKKFIRLGSNHLPEKFSRVVDEFKELYDDNYPVRLIGKRFDRQHDGKRPDSECKDNKCACKLWKIILYLHAYADHACVGSGLPSEHMAKSEMVFIATMMLARRGTMSRIPKSIGIVLPKTRTPQVGITLRSMSHNLSFHQSEVDVFWRSIPWVNREEQTINILIVPWPYEIDAQDFKPEKSQPVKLARSYKYFNYKPSKMIDPDLVLKLINEARKETRRVHLLVLPEAALNTEVLVKIQQMLVNELEVNQLPIIISGITDPGYNDGERIRSGGAMQFEEPDSEGEYLSWNKLVFSVFFAGKWYDHFQSKHHRWKIDAWQIKKYGLAGVLSPKFIWWEHIRVTERRLSFFAPNGWLVFCPLICEDLARLEPVSEVIRGVGPTLLLALLLDGPQSKHRWSGQYASIFADDPGSSVLTITAAGMVKRSTDFLMSNKCIIGLWKDEETGWYEIELKPKAKAVLLTITADWKKEYTIDSRDDDTSSARFVISSERSIFLNEESKLNHSGDDKQCTSRESPFQFELQQDRDLLELTTAVNTIDALIDYEFPLDASVWSYDLKLMKKLKVELRKSLESVYNQDENMIYEGDTGRVNKLRAIKENDVFLETLEFLLGKVETRQNKDDLSVLANMAKMVKSFFDSTSGKKKLRTKGNNKYDVKGKNEYDKEGEREVVGKTQLERRRIQLLTANSVIWSIYRRVTEKRKTEIDPEILEKCAQIEAILEEYRAGMTIFKYYATT